MDTKNNHEYFAHKYNTPNKIRDDLYLLGNKFKISMAEKEFFKKKLKNNLYDIGLKKLKILYFLNLLDKKKISMKDIDFFRNIEKISIPKFPFDGKYLLKRGVQEGKKIGIILKEAEKIWVENNFNLSSDDFEKIIKKNINSNYI